MHIADATSSTFWRGFCGIRSLSPSLLSRRWESGWWTRPISIVWWESISISLGSSSLAAQMKRSLCRSGAKFESFPCQSHYRGVRKFLHRKPLRALIMLFEHCSFSGTKKDHFVTNCKGYSFSISLFTARTKSSWENSRN